MGSYMFKIKKEFVPYLFILPTVILFVFILALPLYNLIKFSLGDSNIIQGYTTWNHFENYKYLISREFLETVKVTLIYVLFGVLGIVVFGTAVSLALNKPMRGLGLFRAIVIIPWVVPHAFAASMWSWVVNPQFGFLNQLLTQLHLVSQPISFLSEKTALITVIIVRIWQGTPFMIISLLAALQTIPTDIEEASSLDGANAIQKFFYITVPYIKPVLITTTMIISAWTVQIFDTVYIMTNGGPARKTQLIALEIYAKAFNQSDLGTASAIALVTLLIVGLMCSGNFRKERVE